MNNQEAGTLRPSKDFWWACVDVAVLCDKTLSQSAKFIFSVLCIFATTNNRGVWPSNDTVAEIACVSVATVKRAYKELADRGVIARSERYDEKDGGQTSSYTTIVGHNAPCYDNKSSPMTYPPFTDELPPSSPMSHKEYHMNNKDSFTRGADLPTSEEAPKDSKPESRAKSFSPEDAPEIMRSTAEYLLLKTRRKTLTENEISALRELSANHYPARVQKEIDTACERFNRNGNDLGTLTFCYIAGALRNQPSRKKKSRKKSEPDGMSLTQAEIDATRTEQTEEELDEELAELKAEMLEGGCE